MKSQIIIVQENGIAKPHFCCGHCGKVIEDASEANFVWNPDKPDETMVICKAYACEETQERNQGGRCWMDLDTAWFYLKSNSKIEEKRVREKAKALASIGA